MALGIIGNPDIIFLDEPTTGFDPAARRQAWEVIRGLTSLGKTVILTTHYLDEAESLADRVGIIVSGRIVELGKPSEIGGDARRMARVTLKRSGGLAEADVPELPGRVSEDGGVLSVRTETPTAAVRTLTDWARSLGVDELPELRVTRPSLEEIYLDLIGHEHAEAADE